MLSSLITHHESKCSVSAERISSKVPSILVFSDGYAFSSLSNSSERVFVFSTVQR
uniref:Uncharacterized protein n=1 Tax=Ascaris lumbricoides TaxID=6252 RepID=A0A0M3IQN7_ASCLU